VLAELYRRRWEIEKVFDELKNKLSAQKAWATGLVAKESQGQLVAITHNLMQLYQGRLEQEHGVEDTAEEQRRKKRIEELQRVAANLGRAVSSLLLDVRKATQRSVKFVRWLRHAVREQLTETTAVPRLSLLLASL
jgi:Transposase DDE domain